MLDVKPPRQSACRPPWHHSPDAAPAEIYRAYALKHDVPGFHRPRGRQSD